MKQKLFLEGATGARGLKLPPQCYPGGWGFEPRPSGYRNPASTPRAIAVWGVLLFLRCQGRRSDLRKATQRGCRPERPREPSPPHPGGQVVQVSPTLPALAPGRPGGCEIVTDPNNAAAHSERSDSDLSAWNFLQLCLSQIRAPNSWGVMCCALSAIRAWQGSQGTAALAASPARITETGEVSPLYLRAQQAAR